MSLPTGCAVNGERAVPGTYVAHDMGLTAIEPPVTLMIAPSHRYRFCQGTRCAAGSWSYRYFPEAQKGRLTIVGPEFETWSLAFLTAAYGNSEVLRQRGIQGSVDMDFDTGPGQTSITIGAGDAAFVRQ
ncbi:hypothetical protein [Sphingomonas sp.]|uniref:hypothetical protein n=1 Tax=Sphingomonas sp. TaxID=28214 RepID=UPI003AFFC93E